MKRAGGLWPAILERGNMANAFQKAARGKRWKREVREFSANIDSRLDCLRDRVSAKRFEVGRFEVFTVFDPKERIIHAAPFEERVFQHALMNLCEPVLEKRAIVHTYACRRGKGQTAAVAAAERAALGYEWYLKLDIRKYFDSVPHGRLLNRLRCVFKDAEVLFWFEKIIESHQGNAARGLPIGTLTSQHLANFYLEPLDRFCQAQPAVKRYVRYMDDFVCWGADKQALVEVGRSIEYFVSAQLELDLKYPPCPQRVVRGMDFLGYRIFPGYSALSRRSKVRYARKLKWLVERHEEGELSEVGLQQRLTALTAFTQRVRARSFRGRVHGKMRSTAIGLVPGDPGRELEQQRGELHGCQPQQQQSGEPQQQQRLPGGPQLRPQSQACGSVTEELNRPSSGSRAP